MMDRIAIFGATSAIAQAAARRFAAAGAAFVLVGRDRVKLAAVVEDLTVRGAVDVHVVEADLADVEGQDAVVAECLRLVGDVDAALIAYGTLPEQARCEREPAYAAAQLQLNAVSVIALALRLARHFESRGTGCLAVITSVAGERGRRGNYVYGAAKGAVSTFLEGLRARLRRARVRVVDIRPGWVRTPMTAALSGNALFADPDGVGRAIHRGMGRGRAVVYAPWIWRPIMWLVRWLPPWVVERLERGR